MHTSPRIQAAPAVRTVGPKSRKQIRITVTVVEGSWFTVHGDKKEGAGFDLYVSTDAGGGTVEISVPNEEADAPLPALRLHADRSSA